MGATHIKFMIFFFIKVIFNWKTHSPPPLRAIGSSEPEPTPPPSRGREKVLFPGKGEEKG
jgi:hypothetical protein